jgi:hypothetical protein
MGRIPRVASNLTATDYMENVTDGSKSAAEQHDGTISDEELDPAATAGMTTQHGMQSTKQLSLSFACVCVCVCVSVRLCVYTCLVRYGYVLTVCL